MRAHYCKVSYPIAKSKRPLLLPRSSTSRHDRYACYASRGKHHLHRGGFRIQRMRNYSFISCARVVMMGGLVLQSAACSTRSWNIAADETTVAVNVSVGDSTMRYVSAVSQSSFNEGCARFVIMAMREPIVIHLDDPIWLMLAGGKRWKFASLGSSMGMAVARTVRIRMRDRARECRGRSL